MRDETTASRPRDLLAAAALFLATAAFTLWQNTRIIALWDVSFLLDTSYRWGLGQLPYKTLPFPHAPLTFLLHTAIIRLFGRVYYPHILCAALEAGLATLLTWRILLSLLHFQQAVIPAQPESPYLPPLRHAWLLATSLTVPLIFLGIYGVYPHPSTTAIVCSPSCSPCTFCSGLTKVPRAMPSPARSVCSLSSSNKISASSSFSLSLPSLC